MYFLPVFHFLKTGGAPSGMPLPHPGGGRFPCQAAAIFL